MRLLIDAAADYAMFLLDADGRIITWNHGAVCIFGWNAREVVGTALTVLYPPAEIADRQPRRELERAAAHGGFAFAGWRQRKDQSRFWATGLITPLNNADGGLRGFAVTTRDLTEQYHYQQALRENESRLAGIIGSAWTASSVWTENNASR